jgi:hypothetical protein
VSSAGDLRADRNWRRWGHGEVWTEAAGGRRRGLTMAANPRVARGLVWEAAERMEKRRRLEVYRTQWALGCIVWVWTLLSVGLRSMAQNDLLWQFIVDGLCYILNALFFAPELKVLIIFYKRKDFRSLARM